MQIGGKYIHQLPKSAKNFILCFVIALSFGYFSGYKFIFKTSGTSPQQIETNYNGNEDSDAEEEKFVFKKSEKEILTIVHTHVLSMSLIFFCLGLILLFCDINSSLKNFLLVEPFLSVLLTFGGIWLLWLGISWMKYIVMLSGMLMTLSISVIVFVIVQQVLRKN